MEIYLICYSVLWAIGWICMYFEYKNAIEVPQDIDIYDI